MKSYFQFLLIVTLITYFSCNRKEEVEQYAATEIFPSDSILDNIAVKKALVITAHDDDICVMSGTISKLNEGGWEIIHAYIPNQSEDRDATHLRAASQILDEVKYIDTKGKQHRKDLDTDVVLWAAMPKSQIKEVFDFDIVRPEIVKIANDFSPTIIFTLDNEIGGYGHPGHVFISQLVLDLAKENKINPKYIYQGVLTKHMERTILEERHVRRMKSWGYEGDGFAKAKLAYGVDGMPEPSVQVNIIDQAKTKMKFLRSYNERERKTMGFYIPAFEQYEAEEYFKIFDREFFRVIEIN
ncbi:MAG: PIG-L family deacetylase [Flavobacteriaceae bacterium]|nr:PIG-L family deacetylase [Flavobacteriaceae bacterium]